MNQSRYLQRTTALYSLLWLLAANLVGLLLAVLLLWPNLGHSLGALTYGRWMPLHMDWQLYGWCSLPLVGLLMRTFLSTGDEAEVHLGYLFWSLALGIGGVMSLQGVVSGKLFLNWAGLARLAFPVAQVILWAILLRASFTRWRRIRMFDTKQWIQLGLLVLLMSSPIALFITAGAEVYPPIDPESGGATGHSLLASSLGIIFIFGLMPHFLKLSHLPSARLRGRIFVLAYIFSSIGWALLEHGNESNTQAGQMIGLAILLFWVPLIYSYFRAFVWPQRLHVWLGAFFFWWGFLTVSGFISFLPGVLDVMKFTNGLVAHAHLAMAGMLGAFNMLLLGTLGEVREGDPWADHAAFWIWQSGTLLYVLSMLIQGVREGLDPTVLFAANSGTTALYALRLLAGLIMLTANLRWLFCLKPFCTSLAGGESSEMGGLAYES